MGSDRNKEPAHREPKWQKCCTPSTPGYSDDNARSLANAFRCEVKANHREPTIKVYCVFLPFPIPFSPVWQSSGSA